MNQSWRMAGFIAAIFLAVSSSTYAVVVSTTTENTTAPADPTFPWNNVGVTSNNLSSVYLGDRWVLTARHVISGASPTSIEFPEVGSFSVTPNSVVYVENTGASLSQFSDLALLRLDQDPGLPSIPITATTPDVGTLVYFVGNGRNRQDDLTFWDADISPEHNIWTEVDDDGEFAGYKTISSQSVRWGTNMIEDDERLFFEFDQGHVYIQPVNGFDTIFLITEFDRESYSNTFVKDEQGRIETDFEAQAVVGDSGGAMFMLNEGTWELAGIINAVQSDNGQDEPGGPPTPLNPIFGDVTLAANLADYRATILSHSGYLLGDFDNNGKLTQNDIDLLTGVVLSGVDPPSFDLNNDGDVNQEDRRVWVEELAFTFFGDSNLDRQFNSADLVVVFQNATYEDDIAGNGNWLAGDWNGDREFDSSDLVAAFQSAAYEHGPRTPGGGGNGNGGAIIVPEPDVARWLLFVVLVSLARRRV
ncbi:MAG: trypsin-like peptidase domain-containing protein [Planctomycetales bacterium]|nr:trypsin-like peptidase domain-containing protein [Planctomycetales bacterium]